MPTANTSTAARARPICPVCVLRHKGLCQGVDDKDLAGSAALESSHSPVRIYDAGEVVYAQGDPSEHVFNLISGWIALHRDLADGRRQIIRFLLPDALFGVEPTGRDLGHGATAITNASVCPIGRAKFDDLRHQTQSFNERFVSILEQDLHRSIESLTTLGQGSAKERIGGLLNELALTAAGQLSIQAGAAFKVPLTQRHIAEATGLTSIHVNRVLRQLREDRVVEFQHGVLFIVDPQKLRALVEFGADALPRLPSRTVNPSFGRAMHIPSIAATSTPRYSRV
jgi:CRP/FNR family transcriptional regulator, anaerobic regulatory protein